MSWLKVLNATAPRADADDRSLLVVMDLDETLIHATADEDGGADAAADFRVGHYSARLRPGAREFMQQLSRHHRVGIWTAANSLYADVVLQHLLPEGYPLVFGWTRERCSFRRDLTTAHESWTKPMTKLWRRGYDRARTVLVDDHADAASQSYGNWIPVPAWRGDDGDDVLPRLLDYLAELAVVADVRPFEKRGWWQRTT